MTPRPRNATFAIVVLRKSPAYLPLVARGGLRVNPEQAALTLAPPRLWWPTLSPTVVDMAVNKEQVLGALAKVASPGGAPLTEARVLSDVVVTDGKVFFSITVDAAAVKLWEPVRKQAEETVRAIPGVQSAMVALT